MEEDIGKQFEGLSYEELCKSYQTLVKDRMDKEAKYKELWSVYQTALAVEEACFAQMKVAAQK